jgi:hypothetical protein
MSAGAPYRCPENNDVLKGLTSRIAANTIAAMTTRFVGSAVNAYPGRRVSDELDVEWGGKPKRAYLRLPRVRKF